MDVRTPCAPPEECGGFPLSGLFGRDLMPRCPYIASLNEADLCRKQRPGHKRDRFGSRSNTVVLWSGLCRIVRAFLVEEQKIVKKVLKQQKQQAKYVAYATRKLNNWRSVNTSRPHVQLPSCGLYFFFHDLLS